MIKIKNIKTVTIPKNYCLVEAIDDSDNLSAGGIDIQLGNTKEGLKYNEGEFSVRRGYLIQLPDKVTYNEAGTPWMNDMRPVLGNVVFFDYLSGKVCEKVICNDKIYYILPYRSLVLHLDPNMDTDTIIMLNGFMLAQQLPKPRESALEIKDEMYEDRFVIKQAGICNRDYINGKIDDESVQEGSRVMTLAKNYPTLEADFQLRLDGEKYVYFKRETVIGILT